VLRSLGIALVVVDLATLAGRGGYALIHTDHWPDAVTLLMLLVAFFGSMAWVESSAGRH
jgi:hypothetical protein